jgi:hypothetical protein
MWQNDSITRPSAGWVSQVKMDRHGSIVSVCPQCEREASFVHRDITGAHRGEYGFIQVDVDHQFAGTTWPRILYVLYACVVCRHPGVLKSHAANSFVEGAAEWFWPSEGMPPAMLPSALPQDLEEEFREAERCTSANCWRAAAALLRSTLEKTLNANGYTKRTLFDNIEDAATEGLITAARAHKAHDVIRTLGNDVLHDEWREVAADEVMESAHFVQRILEDFYVSRPSVEETLTAKKRAFTLFSPSTNTSV